MAIEIEIVWVGEIVCFGKGRRREREMGRNDQLGERERGRGRSGRSRKKIWRIKALENSKMHRFSVLRASPIDRP